MSYQPGMRMPMLTVMGMLGALGKMNLVSGNLFWERHCSARKDLRDVIREDACMLSLWAMRLPSCAAATVLAFVV